MSDNGEVEVENPVSSYTVLPKDVVSEIGSIKLFNKWSYEDVEIRDISLTYDTDMDAHFFCDGALTMSL
jgi:small subunit ribosomal protein S5e